MNILQSIILSIVEGFSEFLPISSTGHLILTGELLRIPGSEFLKSFEIIIQLGAILAVVVLYWKKLWGNFPLWKNIAIAFAPSIVIGLVFYDYIKASLLGNSLVVVWSLLLGGIVMIFFEKYFNGKKIAKFEAKHYLLIGIFQSFAMVPGVSRAMATIFGGMFVGMDRKRATEFSFLLAIPTMFGATTLDLMKTSFSFTQTEVCLLLVGLVGAFVTALFTIKFLIKFVASHDFTGFGVYRIFLAIAHFILAA
ncbi:undecaprenyl-diphosphatase UppP [Candidatus Microgenomates bacterium]|nr:undecaprenyl-diphosphatase UppP [Candidatus Microgenomates bacterium]